MPSKAVVLVVVSFLLVVLIYGPTATFDVFAKPKLGSITCHAFDDHKVECCQPTLSSITGRVLLVYCTTCEDTVPPSNCSDRYLTSISPVGNALPPPGNNTGTTTKLPPGATSVGNALPPPGNNTGTTTMLPPGAFKPTGNVTNALPTGNNTSNTIAKAAGANSPTGYCARSVSTTCLPCDPGLPGGQDTCIPSSQWPGSISFKNNSRLATATPLGNLTNAQPTGNNTSTAHPPPTLLAKQPSSGHHQHKGGQTGTSSSNTNSTGR